MPSLPFSTAFKALTGNPPFPWQSALYERFAANNPPTAANIPTGLGKTSIIAVWLIALANHPDRIPRRLVYVVNRRTVVDQTTTEVERLRNVLGTPELAEIRNALVSLCALPLPTPDAPPLAISTLRGQFADNGEWCTDPSRPAVVIGTVDMIGSGLLFSRYARGFKTRPLYAGFLAQHALLVHDEAHLEPSFQKLLESIVDAQEAAGDLRQLRIIELTATSRTANTTPPFTLTDADHENEIVRNRFNAAKKLSLVSVTKNGDGKDSANDGAVREKILDLALGKKDSHRAVLIFVRSVKAAEKISGDLHKAKQAVATLTGTMRGKERDSLVSTNAVFQRFLPEGNRDAGVPPTTGTVFLVATSAGEVGVNFSADDLVCDLSTYESMAQRFGRVNRFGEHKDDDASEISVVYHANLQAIYNEGLTKARSASKDADKKVAAYESKNQSVLRIIKTLALLEELKKCGDSVSPSALAQLDASKRAAAFSPEPEQRVATEIQFDAWALTSVRQPIAARPPVAPYLHGEAEWQPPETHVAWRKELDVINTSELRTAYPPTELLEDFPLKPHELLRDTSERVFDRIVRILSDRQKNNDPLPDAWLVHEDGAVEIFPLSYLVSDQDPEDDNAENENEEGEGSNTSDAKKGEKARKNRALSRLANATLILPASLGGIDENGLLTPDAAAAPEGRADVADIVAENSPDKRRRVWSNTRDVPAGFRAIRIIDRFLVTEDAGDSGDSPSTDRYWLWLEANSATSGERRFTAKTRPETLAAHTAAVTSNAVALAERLLPPELGKLLVTAARLHDLGKNRAQWQRNLGNFDYNPAKPETILAKSAPGMRPRTISEHYRHEFGSLNDASGDAEFSTLSETEREIVLHLVAAHHGRARPHFPYDEIGDSSSTSGAHARLATEIPRRFARLQNRFGRWGLAWLESLLRAADYAASAGIIAQGGTTTNTSVQRIPSIGVQNEIAPTATLVVDPANPGHYFACCGLFELASHVAPDALAWFEQAPVTRQWRFHLANISPFAELLTKITGAEIGVFDTDDATASPLEIGTPFNVRLDWWKTSSRDVSALKVWAGTMEAPRIARAMQAAVKIVASGTDFAPEKLFFDFRIAYDSVDNTKKVEPFYFDANRGPNAHSRDVGFATNDLQMETLAAPAVELLTLVGLQRAIPAPVPKMPRNFDYHLWVHPLCVSLLPAAVNGLLPDNSHDTYRFESWFRTGQRKHKAFLTARTISSR